MVWPARQGYWRAMITVNVLRNERKPPYKKLSAQTTSEKNFLAIDPLARARRTPLDCSFNPSQQP
jgi:hypothetical protein